MNDSHPVSNEERVRTACFKYTYFEQAARRSVDAGDDAASYPDRRHQNVDLPETSVERCRLNPWDACLIRQAATKDTLFERGYWPTNVLPWLRELNHVLSSLTRFEHRKASAMTAAATRNDMIPLFRACQNARGGPMWPPMPRPRTSLRQSNIHKLANALPGGATSQSDDIRGLTLLWNP